jgi:hypothetical protein
MVKTGQRALSLFLTVFLPEIILLILGFYYIPPVAAYFGMSVYYVIWIVFLPILSSIGILLILWHHLVMRIPFHPFKQSFLHPRVLKEGSGKIMMLLLGLVVLVSLGNIKNPINYLISIAIILASWYSLVVEIDFAHDITKYTKLYNPLKRTDEF